LDYTDVQQIVLFGHLVVRLIGSVYWVS